MFYYILTELEATTCCSTGEDRTYTTLAEAVGEPTIDAQQTCALQMSDSEYGYYSKIEIMNLYNK